MTASESVVEVTHAMSVAIAPVFLISGVGVLLGSMATRYGRVIDRARFVLREAALHNSQENAARDPMRIEREITELRQLYRRAQLLRATIIFAAASIFCISLTVVLIFANYFFNLPLPSAVAALFLASLVFLILSVGLFIDDFAVSLNGLKYEMKTRMKRDIV